MNTQGEVMNQPTQPVEGKPGKPNTSRKSRPVRVAALLSTAATLGAGVLIVAMAGPKLPPYQGD
jgi:hypothetical protein